MPFRYVNDRMQARQEALDDKSSENVKLYFAKHATMREEDAENALLVFDKMKEADFRLACDCVDTQRSPLLCAAHPAQLRRMPPPNPRHSKTCVFVNREIETGSVILPTRTLMGDGNLAIHGEFVDPVDANRSTGSSRQATRHFPKISQLLFKIIDASGINCITPGVTSDAIAQARQAWDMAQRMTLCRDQYTQVTLGSMLVTTTPGAYGEGVRRIMGLKRRIGDPPFSWPVGSRPQGFMIGIFSDIKESNDYFELTLPGWKATQRVEVRPYVFAEGGNFRRAPYIGIVSFARPARNDTHVLGMRAYLQPCLSEDNWFPVDSRYERETVMTLIGWRNTLPDGYSVTIMKPLFDEPVLMPDGNQVSVRADFVLAVMRGGEHVCDVAIETMGMNRPDYEEQKRRTHPAMLARWGKLIQHEMRLSGQAQVAAATERFRSQLTGATIDGLQPFYDSIAGCPGVPAGPR